MCACVCVCVQMKILLLLVLDSYQFRRASQIHIPHWKYRAIEISNAHGKHVENIIHTHGAKAIAFIPQPKFLTLLERCWWWWYAKRIPKTFARSMIFSLIWHFKNVFLTFLFWGLSFLLIRFDGLIFNFFFRFASNFFIVAIHSSLHYSPYHLPSSVMWIFYTYINISLSVWLAVLPEKKRKENTFSLNIDCYTSTKNDFQSKSNRIFRSIDRKGKKITIHSVIYQKLLCYSSKKK